jgi:tRNA(Arg) A34 adenosine deaminase TadA
VTHAHGRRGLVIGLTVATAVAAVAKSSGADTPQPAVDAAEMARHKRNMQLAIDQAKRNPGRPFGCVIVDDLTGEVTGEGVVNMAANPMFHAEVVAMNDYIARHGNLGWDHQTMYGTGEPCPMCMSAAIWAGLPSLVYASDTPFVRKFVNNINIRAKDVIAAAQPLYKSKLLLGGVLSDVTDKMFEDRDKASKPK